MSHVRQVSAYVASLYGKGLGPSEGEEKGVEVSMKWGRKRAIDHSGDFSIRPRYRLSSNDTFQMTDSTTQNILLRLLRCSTSDSRQTEMHEVKNCTIY